MGDVRTAYEPDDEVEALAIEAFLREEEIPCRLRRGADTAYPGIADQRGAWGAILVDEADLERAQGLIADFLAAEAESVEPELGPYRDVVDEARFTQLERRVKSGLPWLLVLLALGGSLVLNAKFILQQRLASSPAGNLPSYDADGVLLSEGRFREGAQFPYESVSYSADGRPLARFEDRESDGWIERSELIHRGSLRTVYVDEDADGVSESARVEREGEVIAELTDLDGDQVYEEVRSGDLVFRDGDGDTIFDEVICTDEPVARTFHVATCSMR